MAEKEIRLNHQKISDPQKITGETVKAFEKQGLDIHRHEVTEIVDDFDKKERVLKVQKKQYFTVGRVPWHED